MVAVRACGICGTDLHLLSGELGEDRFPLIPGHEPWGEVVAVGAEVSGYRAGDLVAVDPSLHCGACDPCRRGRGNMCERWQAIGATRPGAWAEFTAVPAANLHRLEPGFPSRWRRWPSRWPAPSEGCAGWTRARTSRRSCTGPARWG
ncbi:alcohol dehydrogenase catalytic domain-containing protein [Phytohabitans flavus]|uniref:alcohol dehydrogenase catalytic domain-containing protein n=1 Tax=Phytohabitans flavus TaxID=1076124 RepID=UPI003625D541